MSGPSGSRWVRWFQNDEAVREQDQQYDAKAWLDVFDSPVFQGKIMGWLEAEINKATPIESQDKMVATAIRANTLKELRTRLAQDAATARRLLTNE